MKKLLLSVIAVFVLCLSAQAQNPIYAPQPLVGHISIAASTATNLNLVIDCRKQKNITLGITSTNTVDGLTGAGAGSYYLYYKRSVDGVAYDTTGFQAACPAPNGFTAITWTTNLDVAGCGYLKLIYATNAMASATNVGDLNITYGIKVSAP